MPEDVHLLISEPVRSMPSAIRQVLKQRNSRVLRGNKKTPRSQMALPFATAASDGKAF
jgi:REP element-mobilizing transposase RayT